MCVHLTNKWHWKVVSTQETTGSSLQTCFQVLFCHSIHTELSNKTNRAERGMPDQSWCLFSEACSDICVSDRLKTEHISWSLFDSLCLHRPIFLIHMLRRKMFSSLGYSLLLLLFSHVKVHTGMQRISCLQVTARTHLNIELISLEELLSVAACLPCGGLVFQTGFVNGTFRAGTSLCG